MLQFAIFIYVIISSVLINILYLIKFNCMLTKEKIQKTIDSLPEEISVDELIDRIILLDKIEQGLADVAHGNTYSTKEAKQRLNKWLKQSGPTEH